MKFDILTFFLQKFTSIWSEYEISSDHSELQISERSESYILKNNTAIKSESQWMELRYKSLVVISHNVTMVDGTAQNKLSILVLWILT